MGKATLGHPVLHLKMVMLLLGEPCHHDDSDDDVDVGGDVADEKDHQSKWELNNIPNKISS